MDKYTKKCVNLECKCHPQHSTWHNEVDDTTDTSRIRHYKETLDQDNGQKRYISDHGVLLPVARAIY